MRHRRWVLFGLVYIYTSVLYLGTNHIHWFPVRILPLTPIDTATPYLPWTGWIYILVYVFPLFAGIIAREEDVNRMALTFASMTTVTTMVFIFYPTAYPRPPMELEHTFANFALRLVQLLDTPANSLPSQHVAVAFLCAFFIQLYNRKWGNFALVIGILISISTLTTKQHYIWDVLIGYSLARFSYLIGMATWTRSPARSQVH